MNEPVFHAVPNEALPNEALPNEALRARLATLSGRYPSMDLAATADVVRAVLLTITGDLSTRETALLAEVEALGLTIVSAKAEIAAMRVEEINDLHIPTATDELDEIVQHTAAATNTILEACETLDTVQEKLDGEPALALQHATTRIYEACSFQDITGQRITKIVTALHAIESRIAQRPRANRKP
jgi:chemotaxis protein CheZ